MKAIVQDRYGSADVLELRDVEIPQPGDDELLIRVHAAGVDPGVWHLMTNLPYLVRAMGFGFRKPKIRIRGVDAAGTVEAAGKNVIRLKQGDQVYGTCDGSFAEYACAKAERFAPKPANLTFEQAAAVPISGMTALNGLRDAGKLQPGQKVLIIGAAGGVGTYAVQLAKAFGAAVTGVCSTSKANLMRALGADEVIDYTREDFCRRGRCEIGYSLLERVTFGLTGCRVRALGHRLMSPTPQRPPQPEAPSTLGSERAFAVVGPAVGVASICGSVGDEVQLRARPTLRPASPTSCVASSTPCRPSGYGGTWI
jgi:D-arabinose 1-dehydrogenase-like Zn-dependent alcohol dehydrogenase